MKLKFVKLNPNDIFNWTGPENVTAWCAFPELQDRWWEPDSIELRREFAETWINEFDKITNHFKNLTSSIRYNGILTPVSCVSGPIRDVYLKVAKDSPVPHPPHLHNNLDKVIYTHPFGGSRVVIAKQLELKEIPVVVHDFSNLFPNAEEVSSKNYRKWFPNGYAFVNAPPYIRLLKHSHMRDGLYCSMNDNTRKAQRLASQRAKEIINVKYRISRKT